MDIRKAAGDKLKHYNVMQGSCAGGDYIFVAFEQKKNKKKGRKHRIKIVKLDKTGEKVLKVSKPLKIGHANDMAYRDGILYVTHSGDDDKKSIHRIDANSLEKLSNIRVKGIDKGGFNGIACFGSGYLLKKMRSHKIYVVDSSFRFLRSFKLKKKFSTSQGIDWHKGRLYQATSTLQSKHNYINVYTIKGKRVKRIHYAKKCELEGVFFCDDICYIGIYKKQKKGKKKTYMGMLERISI